MPTYEYEPAYKVYERQLDLPSDNNNNQTGVEKTGEAPKATGGPLLTRVEGSACGDHGNRSFNQTYLEPARPESNHERVSKRRSTKEYINLVNAHSMA